MFSLINQLCPASLSLLRKSKRLPPQCFTVDRMYSDRCVGSVFQFTLCIAFRPKSFILFYVLYEFYMRLEFFSNCCILATLHGDSFLEKFRSCCCERLFISKFGMLKRKSKQFEKFGGFTDVANISSCYRDFPISLYL